MSNNLSIREQLTFKAWLQVFLIVASIVFGVVYILPTFQDISVQAESANAAAKKYQDLQQNGIPYEQLTSTLTKIGKYESLIKIIKDGDVATIREAIKKTDSTKSYIEWLSHSLKNSDQSRAKLADQRARINSIIPTLSPNSDDPLGHSVSLKNYISFVEQNILKKFSLQSTSTLGIEGVKYKTDQEGNETNEIGTFEVDLNFKAINKDIISLLNYIHETGEPSILTQKEMLSEPPKIMSNPLIIIDSLSLEKNIDSDNLLVENSGRITLRFFVRGSSATDKVHLISTFQKKYQELNEKLNDEIKKCKNESCPAEEHLTKLQIKLTKFNDSFSAITDEKKWNLVESIYIIGQQIRSLDDIQEELKNIK